MKTWREWLRGIIPRPADPAPAKTRFTVRRVDLPLSHFIEQAPVQRRRFRLTPSTGEA